MIDRLLSLVAPHICKGCGREGTTLCNRCKININAKKFRVCVVCGGSDLAVERGNLCVSHARRSPFSSVVVVDWRSGVLKRLVGDFKYFSERESAAVIAQLLNSVISVADDVVITAIPTSASHIRQRGFDHMKLVGRELAKSSGLEYRELLSRTTNQSQHELPARARRELAARSFSLKPRVAVPEKVLLIDDIWTTGATVTAAAKLLKKAGTKQICLGIIARQPAKSSKKTM